MRTIIWFIYFWVILICYCPFQWYAVYLERKGKIQQKEALVSKCVTAWAWSLLKLAGVRLTVSGKENIPNETCIYVSNHQGNFDIPILLTCLDKPHALLAKKEIRKIPMVRTWMKLFGCIFIDRNNMRNAMTAINEAIEAVKQGKSMIIFPEGTRSKGGEMGQFKGGAFRVCEKSRVKIVPVAISGSYKVMEQNGFWIKPADVKVTILPAVETKDMEKEEIKELADKIKQQIGNNI